MNKHIRLCVFTIILIFYLASISSAEKDVIGSKSSGQTINFNNSSKSEVKSDQPKKSGKLSDRFPNITLRTQDNKPVRFYDDLVKDKIIIVNFMYTRCPGICMPTAFNLAKVHKFLGDRVGRDILMLSISLDSEYDTPERLKEYAKMHGGEKPGWLYLTGDYDEIESLRYKLGVYDLDPIIDADKTQHSGIITFGSYKTDRWAALPALMNSEEIAETVLRITKDRDQKRYHKNSKVKQINKK